MVRTAMLAATALTTNSGVNLSSNSGSGPSSNSATLWLQKTLGRIAKRVPTRLRCVCGSGGTSPGAHRRSMRTSPYQLPGCLPSEMKPETFGEGEPGTQAKGLDAGLGLSLGVTRDGGLVRLWPRALPGPWPRPWTRPALRSGLRSFLSALSRTWEGRRRGICVGKSVGVPTPGRPTPWVLHPLHPLWPHRQT